MPDPIVPLDSQPSQGQMALSGRDLNGAESIQGWGDRAFG